MRLFRSIATFLLPVLAVIAFQQDASAAGRGYYLTQATMAAYYVVVTLGLALLMGHAGQVSLGHGAFFALGGYTSAILTTRPLDLPPAAERTLSALGCVLRAEDAAGVPQLVVAPPAAFAAALLLTLAVALLVGYPTLLLRGYYLAMATLGFGLIVYRVLLGTPFTGAADGIHGVPGWSFGGAFTLCGRRDHRVANYYFAWGAALLTLLLLRNLIRSRFGRALAAIHDHETAAGAMGVNTAACKLQAFVVSALLAAAAGVFATHFNGGIGPSEAGALKSVRYVALVAAGGMGNLPGVLAASAGLTFLSLRDAFGTYDDAVFGAILIAVVTWAPQGPLEPLGRALRGLAAWRPARREAARRGAA